MSSSALDYLTSTTVIVADSGDLEAIAKSEPRDATTNPSLILAAAKDPKYISIVNDTIKHCAENYPQEKVISEAVDLLSVVFGNKILNIVKGRVSTEVDARLSYDEEATYIKANKLIKMYEERGISKERVLVKVAATWEGIKAAERLEKEGIHCNLTLLFGFEQAIACAEAGVTLVSPFVGRILDWYKKNTGKNYEASEDPGVLSVTKIYNYFRKYGYSTEVMGASFRNVGEILQLCGCDLLTISPKLIDEMRESRLENYAVNCLDAKKAKEMELERIEVSDKALFDEFLAKDQMASDLLISGIAGFSKAMEDLEKMLAQTWSSLGLSSTN